MRTSPNGSLCPWNEEPSQASKVAFLAISLRRLGVLTPACSIGPLVAMTPTVSGAISRMAAA
jgi:hypothetical protein